jgi:DNA-binding PadR family transcriptional regulator
LRFRALAKELSDRIDNRVEDNALSRSLVRLRRSGLVVVHHTTVGRRIVPIYRITEKGRLQLDPYHALVFTYQQLHPDARPMPPHRSLT